jgi:hypothetical protein
LKISIVSALSIWGRKNELVVFEWFCYQEAAVNCGGFFLPAGKDGHADSGPPVCCDVSAAFVRI